MVVTPRMRSIAGALSVKVFIKVGQSGHDFPLLRHEFPLVLAMNPPHSMHASVKDGLVPG